MRIIVLFSLRDTPEAPNFCLEWLPSRCSGHFPLPAIVTLAMPFRVIFADLVSPDNFSNVFSSIKDQVLNYPPIHDCPPSWSKNRL